MANLSHSVPKKPYYNGNGFGGDKAVYDDVFGGPPKFGVPTLSPRVEDYAEIFGSFHASPRASSIPVLDLPQFDGDEADFSFDSHFDYSQVFGGFNGLDFAISFEELFKHSKTTYDSSDEAWTPAQSESLSEESDPSACSERCRSLSNGGSHQSCDGIKQLNISYNKASQSSKDDMSTGTDHITQLHAVPGFTIVVNETPPKKIEHRHTPLLVTDDIIANPDVDCSGALREGKQFRKTMSLPSNSSFGTQTFGKHTRYSRTASHLNEAFVTVSDISLRTRPSQLPPPLRPPPVFAEKDGECERQESKLTASKSSALGEKEGDSSPPFFDVEVDASSSAAVSAAAMKDAVEKAQAKLTSAKELMERKKEGLQSHTKLGLKNDAKYKKEKASRAIAGSDERAHGTCQRDCIGMQTFAGEERLKVMNGTEVVSYSFEGKKDINVGKISADKRHGKDRLSEGPHKTEATVAWRQAAQYYEVVETDQCRKIFEQAKGERVLVQNTQFRDPGKDKTATTALQQLEDDSRKIRDDREAHELDGNKGRSKATKESSRQEKQEKKVKVNQEVCEQVGNGKKPRMSQLKVPTEADNSEECENLVEVKQKEHDVKVGKKLKEGTESIEYGNTHKDAHEGEESERRLKETSERERYEKRLKEATERAEIEKRLKEALDREEREKQQREACEREEKEKRQKEAHEREENEKRLKEAFEQEENKKRLQEALERVETEKRLKMVLEQEENEKMLKLVHEMDEKEKRLLEDLRREETEKIERGALQQEGNGGNQKEAHEREESMESINEACEREENEKGLKEEWRQDENKKKIQEAHEREDSEERSKEAFKQIETAKRPEEANDSEETQKELKGHSKDHEQHAKYENGMNLKSDQTTNVNKEGETFKASDGGVEVVNVPVEAHISGTAQVDPQHGNNQIRKGNSTDSLHLHDNLKKSVETGIGSRQTQMDRNEKASEIASNTEKPNVLTCELGERGIDVMEVELTYEKEETKDKFMSSQVVGDLVANGRKMGDDQSAVLEEKRKAQGTAQKVSTCQNIERKGKNLNAIVTSEEREKEDRIKKERELEKDRLRKIEEEREREREREKDRMAVDKATLEARERVFAEARERAERAAVERATAEVRQRAMLEARERLEKASAEVRERSSSLAEKASMEARLRAERAAVERATAEARERAFQKAMNEKVSFEARERVERSVVDKPSASCKNGGIRQCSSFSDLQDVQHQGVGSSSGSLYSYSKSFHGGVEGESAQRCKARLERHRRTAERAAKALAEKNTRDLLAQREQTERNRLAEALDAEVKRWSSGKEGNLRALLSTLQYILGPNSGWQPIPLTEVITSAAVKKAYRKATLCVHPDKLQQRGASIQQKYICEKVFDLLKESWNRFNSEER